MITSLVINGNITKQDTVIKWKLFDATSSCKIRVIDIILTPNYPDNDIEYMDEYRHFSLSTNLVTRKAYINDIPIEQETPLCIFLKKVNENDSYTVENPNLYYYTINNSVGGYCDFTFKELAPRFNETCNSPRDR